MTRFRPFRWTSSLIWGDGGLLFHFILSKIVGFGSCKEVLLQFFYSLQIGGVSGFKMDKYHSQASRQAGRQVGKWIIPEPESKQQRIHMEFSDNGTASF